MFCPNCGAENKDSNAPCQRCGFKLSGVSASKFKGTIMLNSDETVQELIEAQRRKLAEASGATGAKDPWAPAEGANPPAGATPNPSSPNVPRPRRKMAGTLMGVAPPVGVLKPGASAPQTPDVGASTPEAEGSADEPRRSSIPPRPSSAPPRPTPIPRPSPSNRPSTPPRAGVDPTQAMQAFTTAGAGEVAPTLESPAVTKTSTQPDAPARAPSVPPAALLNGRTVPIEQFQAAQAGSSDAARSTASDGVEPASTSAASTASPRLTASEIFLVVATCGVYGLVLRKKRSRP